MTSILAHDIDGRPLRAWDRVVIVYSDIAAEIGVHEVLIIGPQSDGDANAFDIDVPFKGQGYKNYALHGYSVRRLDADHIPADTGFTELMTNLKTGSLEPLEIEL